MIRAWPTGISLATWTTSCAVEDSGQLIGVFAFAVEGAADRSEGLGERKNVARNKQIGIFRPDRMPVHTRSSNRDFRHEIGSTDGDTFAGNTTQRDPAYDSVLCRNLLLIEELTERFSLGIGRNRGRQSHSKAMRTSALVGSPCPPVQTMTISPEAYWCMWSMRINTSSGACK